MKTWIYGVLVGLIIGYFIGSYASVSEGFQSTANDPIPELNSKNSCATIETLNQAFVERIKGNPIFALDRNSSPDIASSQDSLTALLEKHEKVVADQKAAIGCP